MTRRRTLRSGLTAAGLAVAVVAAGCSSSDTASSDDTAPSSTIEAAGSSAADDPAPSTTPSTTTAAPNTTTTTEPSPASLPVDYVDHQSELYGDLTNWLCHPLADDDVCRRDLSATAVADDGSTELVPHEPAADPAVDCFYVYPTVSRDPGYLSDLEPGENEEIQAVVNQAARLNRHCALWAPIYRQNTLASLFDTAVGDEPEEGTREVAYGDVLDSFRQYIASVDGDRGFILIGHSQGSGLLTRLIADEIDDEPALRDRLVSAYLLGSSVGVPQGEVVGGRFDNVALCTTADDTGCVVSYASFRSTAPPPDTSFFGRVSEPGQVAACVDPVELIGSGPSSEPYFAGAEPYAEGFAGDEITTPYVTYPDFLELRCVDDGEFSYLEVTVLGDPADNRTDDITGDLTPDWGLHLVDANIAMGDIVALAGRQVAAFTG
ncbi:MAG: DUF3089 domain-containing protein [Acidimicrobiales bacterium]